MSSSRINVKVSILSVLGTLAIITMLMTPAYADPIIKPTSGGTLNISFETNPTTPNPGDQTMLKIGFLNKQNSIQPHIDYKVSVMQGNDQIFGIPVSHVATEGAVSIPMQFQTAGTYQVIVEVQGILFQPIPPETASFTVVVGPSVPEFGPLAGMVTAASIISVIIVTKKTQFHI